MLNTFDSPQQLMLKLRGASLHSPPPTDVPVPSPDPDPAPVPSPDPVQTPTPSPMQPPMDPPLQPPMMFIQASAVTVVS